MYEQDQLPRRSRHAVYSSVVGAVVLTIALTGCGSKPADANASPLSVKSEEAQPNASRRVVACTIMPKEELNALIGESYTSVESEDDGRSSDTGCHYLSETDPAGTSLSISWVSPRDYADAAEHAALQEAAMGGAKLGKKLTAGIAGGAIPGMPSGPVEGLGDEAIINMLQLSARKGDYTIMLQINPGPMSMIKIMSDSTVGLSFVEKEKAVARKIFSKL